MWPVHRSKNMIRRLIPDALFSLGIPLLFLWSLYGRSWGRSCACLASRWEKRYQAWCCIISTSTYLPISHWQGLISAFSLLPDFDISIKQPAFIEILTELQSVMFSLFMRSCMKEDWLIVNIPAEQFLVTCHPMIVQTSPKSFTLSSLEIPLLSQCSTWKLLEGRRKLSTYTMFMRVLPFLLDMKILESVFSSLNLKVLRNPITFWFHNWPDCLKP